MEFVAFVGKTCRRRDGGVRNQGWQAVDLLVHDTGVRQLVVLARVEKFAEFARDEGHGGSVEIASESLGDFGEIFGVGTGLRFAAAFGFALMPENAFQLSALQGDFGAGERLFVEIGTGLPA